AKSGFISLSTNVIGFCAQEPWIQNCTIRENITGPNNFEDEWYRKVVRITALDTDFDQMPYGDLAKVGSRGLTLSGGQKQRIVRFTLHLRLSNTIKALARAVYSRCPILLLDDCLSALDRKTRRLVVDRLLGTDGYC